MVIGEGVEPDSLQDDDQQLGCDPVGARTFWSKDGPLEWKATANYAQLFAIGHDVMIRLEGQILDEHLQTVLANSFVHWAGDAGPRQAGAIAPIASLEQMSKDLTHTEPKLFSNATQVLASAASGAVEVAESTKQAYEIVLEAIGALGSLAGAAAAIYYGQKFVQGQKPKKGDGAGDEELEMASLEASSTEVTGPSTAEFQRTVDETMAKLGRARDALKAKEESLENSQIKLRETLEAMQAERQLWSRRNDDIDRQTKWLERRSLELEIQERELREWREKRLKEEEGGKTGHQQAEQDLARSREDLRRRAEEVEYQKLLLEQRRGALEDLETQAAWEQARVQEREAELDLQRLRVEKRQRELEEQERRATREQAQAQEREDALELLWEDITREQASLEGEKTEVQTVWKDLTSLFAKMEQLRGEMVALRTEVGRTRGEDEEVQPLQMSQPSPEQGLDVSFSDEGEQPSRASSTGGGVEGEDEEGRPESDVMSDARVSEASSCTENDDRGQESGETTGGVEATSRDNVASAAGPSLENRLAALRIGCRIE